MAIIIVLDGCNIKALFEADVSTINSIIDRGVFLDRLRSIYPTVTYSAHASIITGVYPNEHGIIGNNYYDRKMKRVIDFDLYDVNKFIGKNVKTIFDLFDGTKLSVGEPITRGADIVVSKRDVQSRSLFHQDEYAIRSALHYIKKYKPRLSVINLPGIDGIGELYGPLSDEVIKHLENIDNLLGRLINEICKIYDDYILIIIADHGMTDVWENVDLNSILHKFDVSICVSHRMAHIYSFNKKDLQNIHEKLESDNRIGLVIPNKNLSLYNLDNPRCGDFVVFADEGYEFGDKQLKGSHGGITDSEIYVPIIINKAEYIDILKNERDITIIKKILQRYFLEIDAREYIKNRMGNGEPGHSWLHIERVVKLATKLAVKYNADVEAVRLSSLFHDIGREADSKEHSIKSALIAEKFLVSRGCREELISKVKKIILSHHLPPDKLESIEEKILWDADKLDALGLIGFMRCLLESGYNKKDMIDALNHALKDLFDFSNNMHFPETKYMAKLKVNNFIKLLSNLKTEIDIFMF